MSDLTQLLDQFRARHQRALITRTSVQAVLNLIIGGLIALRLQATHQPLVWQIAVPILWIGATLSLLAWRLRQQWLTTQGAAAQLDRALGLEQRLVTATEFAGRAEQSALYPLLLEDVATRYRAGDVGAPKRFDQISAALVAVLAVLLLWPLPPHAPLTQLAQIPPTVQLPKPPEPPPVQPPPNQQSAISNQQSSKNDRQSTESGQQPVGSRQQANNNQQASAGGQQAAKNKQPSTQSRQQSATSKPKSGQGDQQQSAGGQQQGQGAGRQGQQNATQMMAQQGQSAGAQLNAPGANSEALRGEIQQLLKQMSGELKQIEAQMADAKDQPSPNAGTGTDPSLYEKGEPLPPASTKSDSLPITLDTDKAPTTNNRRAAGVGDATSRASTAAPTALVQDAQLTDTPRSETSGTRQAIPPEYQPVFDRLQQPSNATKDTTQ